jgi:rhodanese-related sulfurtransferase
MEIKPEDLKNRQSASDVLILDVRTPAEFSACHITGAINLPLDRLTVEAAKNLAKDKTEILTICHSGKRSMLACQKLRDGGLNVRSISGGTVACEQQGLTVEKQSGVISLERQVRIAAGALVLAGALGAILISPTLIYLSAFVGAGLVFSGVTDTCGMALVLARMPWNQASSNSNCCQFRS